jgi:hypothetical protein
LIDTEKQNLRKLYRQTDKADLRMRCQMILLSAEGYRVAEIAQLTFFEEGSLLYWLDHYEAENLAGLEDRSRSRRLLKSP